VVVVEMDTILLVLIIAELPHGIIARVIVE